MVENQIFPCGMKGIGHHHSHFHILFWKLCNQHHTDD